MEIKKICIVGAGTMGHGIAQLCAQSGLGVSLMDIEEGRLQAAVERIKTFLMGSIEREKITQKDADAALA